MVDSSAGDVQSLLLVIETLLRKYGLNGHAARVATCRDQLATGSAGLEIFASHGWWGGAGSIADVVLHEPGRSAREERRDDRRFRAALIDLYDAMVTGGVTMRQAERWTDIFKQWQQQGL